MIGCDEISYRRGQRYLTQVCDHQTGAIVWARPGRNAQTLQAFFDELGDRRASIRAVSIDMNGGYEKAIRAAVPDAEICFDPFHVVALAGRGVDDVRRGEWNQAGRSKTGTGRLVKGVRWSLLKAPEHQNTWQLAALHEVSTCVSGWLRRKCSPSLRRFSEANSMRTPLGGHARGAHEAPVLHPIVSAREAQRSEPDTHQTGSW
jgi:hypothetical protein